MTSLCPRPSYSLLGHLPGTELYLDMETHEEVSITLILTAINRQITENVPQFNIPVQSC